MATAPGVAAGLLFASLAGCAAGDGVPWGTWSPELQVQHAAEARVTESGALTTVERLEVRVDTLSIGLGALALTTGGAAGGVFDPAAPPEGYGLCHAGHCHHDDGRLVPYEEIAAELSDGAPAAPAAVAVVDLTVPLAEASAAVPIASCPNACALPRGATSAITLELTEFSFDVRVSDPELGRFDGERRVSGTLVLDSVVAAPLALAIGPSTPPNVTTTVDVVLDARWVDAFTATEVDPLGPDAEVTDTLSAALTEAIAASLDLRVRSSRKHNASSHGVAR